MFSKYIDNTKDQNGTRYLTMDEIIKKIKSNENPNEFLDSSQKEIFDYQVSFEFEENENIELKGTEFSYNIINYYYQTEIPGQEDNAIDVERFQSTEGSIVIYTEGNRTQYICDRARGSRALRILRIVTAATRQGQIEAAPYFSISEDFFDWLIYKFMMDHKLLDEENELMLNQISGFKGQGLEKQATLSGNGNEVMNLFSSMAFLLETDELTEIEINLSKENETFVLKFYATNSQVDTYFNLYIGIEMFSSIERDREARILLKVFIEILPLIEIAFNEDKEDDEWNEQKREILRTTIADSIREKIDGFL